MITLNMPLLGTYHFFSLSFIVVMSIVPRCITTQRNTKPANLLSLVLPVVVRIRDPGCKIGMYKVVRQPASGAK
jgi:hypothetical protein